MIYTARSVLVALPLAFVAAVAFGQAPYPNRPIRLVVPFAPGGASDIVARTLALNPGQVLGQDVVIDNRVGASGNIGLEAVARASPDGYTLLLGNIGAIAINPAIYRNLSIDPLKDFIPVTLVADVPSVLIANPGVPADSVAGLIALARAKPGELNFASTGSGALSRLEMEQFRRSANLDVVHIPYKGGAGPAVNGMLGGETHVMFVTLPSVISFIQAGKLKALGISTAKRVDLLPRVPTMAEAGFPDRVNGAWQGVFVPTGTPRPIVDKLHGALLATLGLPEVRLRLVGGGVSVEISKSPEAFAAFVDTEIRRWGKVAKESGATID